jgi:hypothetical protein
MKDGLTSAINHICIQLDTNPYLGKEQKQALRLELDTLVDRRNKLNEVFKTSWTLAEEKEVADKIEEDNDVSTTRKSYR